MVSGGSPASWGTTSLARRTQVLFAFRELLNSRKDELAAIITSEHGKVHSDALGEIARRSVQVHPQFARRLRVEQLSEPRPDVLGVPARMPGWHLVSTSPEPDPIPPRRSPASLPMLPGPTPSSFPI